MFFRQFSKLTRVPSYLYSSTCVIHTFWNVSQIIFYVFIGLSLSKITLINSLNCIIRISKKVLVKWMIVEHTSNPEGQ